MLISGLGIGSSAHSNRRGNSNDRAHWICKAGLNNGADLVRIFFPSLSANRGRALSPLAFIEKRDKRHTQQSSRSRWPSLYKDTHTHGGTDCVGRLARDSNVKAHSHWLTEEQRLIDIQDAHAGQPRGLLWWNSPQPPHSTTPHICPLLSSELWLR